MFRRKNTRPAGYEKGTMIGEKEIRRTRQKKENVVLGRIKINQNYDLNVFLNDHLHQFYVSLWF